MKRLLQKQRKYPGALLLTLALTLAAFAARADRLTAVRTYDTSAVRLGTRTAPDGTEFRTVEWGDMHPAAEVGSPELPVEHFRFLVPVYSNNFRATVVSATGASALPLGSRVLPAQVPQKADGSPAPAFTYPKAAAYVRTLAPEAWVVDDGFIDGCNHVVTVAVRPVAYDDATLSASAYGSVTVRLDYDLCGEDGLTGSKPIFPPRASEYVRIEDLVVNTANVTQFAPRRVPDAESGEHSRHYYIIVPDNLKDAVDDLAVWKRQKGYNVVVKTIEEILVSPKYAIDAMTERVDEAASLRAYLQDEYAVRGAFFCLLVGNSKTSMPIRKAARSKNNLFYGETYNDATNEEFFTPTDLYFCDLTTNFQLSIMGSAPPIYSFSYSGAPYIKNSISIYVGRLLASTKSEIANYTEKLIIYESNPGKGKPDYLTSALFFEQYKSPGHGSLIGNSRKVRDVVDSAFSIRLIQSNIEGTYATGKEMISELKKHYGFFSPHAHGNPLGFATASNYGGESPGHQNYYLTSLDEVTRKTIVSGGIWDDYMCIEEGNGLDNLYNTDYPFVVYSISCDNTPFDIMGAETPWCNLGESFTIGKGYGGPAFLGNTRAGSVSNSPDLEVHFFKSLQNSCKIGIAEALSKIRYSSGGFRNHVILTHNLIGEPEFEMWLGKPEKFDGMCVDYRHDRLEVSCRNLANATMGISFGDGRVSWGGLALREFELRRLDTDFSVSFWKPGYLPYIGLFCFEGEITGQTKKYIVQTATLGNPNYTAESSLGYKPTTIGAGTTYNVRAFESITALPNFVIEDGAEVVLDCEKTVELSCTVKAGGKLTVVAKDVRMTPGFDVEKGGIFITKTKQ